VLAGIVNNFPLSNNKNIVAGFENSEDAGVYKLSEDQALVQTLDFSTPVVDDPYVFGQIAASNSLSDVYAMGAKHLTAMNIVCFPVDVFPTEVLEETLRGGRDKIDESGAVLLGGHSVEDSEFKYGLSVTGLADPSKILLNSGAQSGDVIILTKSIGTGIVATALKGKIADNESVAEMVKVMTDLNKYILEVIPRFKVNALTDVTGFGLGGHLMEMARGAKKKFLLDSGCIPFIKGTKEYADMGLIPQGSYRNKEYCKNSLCFKNKTEKFTEDLVYDPQTSGGLILTVKRSDAQSIINLIKDAGIRAEIIGEVGGPDDCGVVEVD
jgi:selenide,water dikinase